MPVIEHSEFDRYEISRATFDPFPMCFYLFPQCQRPLRICARGIQNGCNVIAEYDRGEKSDVDVSRQLENIFVLPRA